MKIKMVGNTALLISDAKTEDIQLVKKFEPEALKIINVSNNSVVFTMDYGAEPSVSKYGICFNKTSVEGNAYLEVEVEAEDKNAAVIELVAGVIDHVTHLETSVAIAATRAEEIVEALNNDIEVIL